MIMLRTPTYLPEGGSTKGTSGNAGLVASATAAPGTEVEEGGGDAEGLPPPLVGFVNVLLNRRQQLSCC